MDSFPFFDLPNELQHKIWSCLDEEVDINEKLLLGMPDYYIWMIIDVDWGFYFIDSRTKSKSIEERWIEENIGLELSSDSNIKEEYALLFYK